MLGRAYLYSFDKDGNKFRRKHAIDDPGCANCGTGEWRCSKVDGCCEDCWHPNEVQVRETPRHALSHGWSDGDDSHDEQVAVRRRREESLTADESDALRLHYGEETREHERYTIAAGDLVKLQRRGYELVPGSHRMVDRGGGLAPIECVDVVGYERIRTSKMTVEEVANRMGKTWRQAKSLISSARRKLATGR